MIMEKDKEIGIIRNFYDRKPDCDFYSTGLGYTYFKNDKDSLDFNIKQLNKANENIKFVKAIKMEKK